MLKLKLQYFGHLMQRTDSLEKTDAGKDWRQEEKGMTKDEMVGWHHRLNRCEFEQTLGVGDGQRSLACCSQWGGKELDTTERLNWKGGSSAFVLTDQCELWVTSPTAPPEITLGSPGRHLWPGRIAARRANQLILKEINLEYSLGGLMLKLQYFGLLMQRADSLGKILMLEKIEGKRRRGWQRMRWLDRITGLMNINLSKLRKIMKNRGTWRAAVQGVANSRTQLNNWTTTSLLWVGDLDEIQPTCHYSTESPSGWRLCLQTCIVPENSNKYLRASTFLNLSDDVQHYLRWMLIFLQSKHSFLGSECAFRKWKWSLLQVNCCSGKL